MRFIGTSCLGIMALVMGSIRLTESFSTLNGVGVALFGLGAIALYQLRFAACDLVLTRCGHMPFLYRYLTAKHIKLLKEIVEIIERDKLNCLIGGGIACDALMTGYLTHIPCDLDLICLSEDEPAIRSALTRAGFVLKSNHPDQVLAHRKGDMMIDILIWQTAEKGKIQHLFGADLLVMPRSLFFDKRAVQLNGVKFFIQGSDMLACAAPWVSRAKHQALLKSTSTSFAKVGRTQWRDALIKVRVTEYNVA